MGKIQVRRGLFETNSSSMHSITMCDDSDFEKWKNGLMVYSKDYECLVSLDNKEYQEWTKKSDAEKEEDWIQYDYLTYDQFFNDWDAIEHEKFMDSYKTPNGKKVIAFGYYGYS
jgi:hypothetical protein